MAAGEPPRLVAAGVAPFAACGRGAGLEAGGPFAPPPNTSVCQRFRAVPILADPQPMKDGDFPFTTEVTDAYTI